MLGYAHPVRGHLPTVSLLGTSERFTQAQKADLAAVRPGGVDPLFFSRHLSSTDNVLVGPEPSVQAVVLVGG